MTQMASLLAVATTSIDLWTPFYSQGEGGLYARHYAGTCAKMQGGLCARGGGVIAGFYGILHKNFWLGTCSSWLTLY